MMDLEQFSRGTWPKCRIFSTETVSATEKEQLCYQWMAKVDLPSVKNLCMALVM